MSPPAINVIFIGTPQNPPIIASLFFEIFFHSKIIPILENPNEYKCV